MTDVGTVPGTPAAAGSIPGPRVLSWQDIRAVRADAPGWVTALKERHGSVVQFPLGPVPCYLVTNPEVIQEAFVSAERLFSRNVIRVGRGPEDWAAPLAGILGRGLLTSTGAFHMGQRRRIQPVFHRKRIDGYAAEFSAHSEHASGQWRDGQQIDVYAQMHELALGMAAKTLFDASLDDDISRTIRSAFPRKGGPLVWEAKVPIGRFDVTLPLPSTLKYRRARKLVDKVVYRIIKDRRAGDLAGNDLLSVLLTVEDAQTGERMDDDLVRDEAVTLLIAAHETVAATLTFAFYLLGQHAWVRERMQAELDEVLGGRLPEGADLPRLVWTNAVVSEVLRVFPPAWATARRTLTEFTADGYVLPADSFTLFSGWVVHRDPQWWPDPERFAPQRWIEAAEGEQDELAGHALQPGRPRMAYMPFGAGPHQCIGNAFARMEAVMVLATIMQGWDLEPVDEGPVTLQTHVTLRPRKPIHVTVRRRSH